ncbi:MAG: N-formylglutamate amidohydrolase [Actinomycetota bacterium]
MSLSIPEPAARTIVAFESARLSYSDRPVDLYNSGVNQLLSLAAARGYSLRHFCMADLYEEEGMAAVRSTVLELGEDWSGDPLEAWKHLRPGRTENLPLDAIAMYFVRGDDIRRADTPNLDILARAEDTAIVLESVEATLATTDKYELVERCPQAPQPKTYAAADIDQAMEAIHRLPHHEGWIVVKDRFGYGCGAQVHRLHVDTPGLEHIVYEYLRAYDDLLVQEFRPEVGDGDVVATFFDDHLLGALRRVPAEGEWKSNASLGAAHVAHQLTPDQAEAAWAVRRAFPECRLASVDILPSGRVLEINAFPGADGLLETQEVVLAEHVLDQLEREIDRAPAGPDTRPTVGRVHSLNRRIQRLYDRGGLAGSSLEALDVFAGDVHQVGPRELIEVRTPPGSDDLLEYPVIVSVPHSGVLIPVEFADRFPHDDGTLVEIDLFSHLLYEQLPATQVVSKLAPYFLDMNRGRAGADEAHVPRHLHNPPHEYYTVEDELILQRPYEEEEIPRVLRFYDLYHDLINVLIDSCRRRHGWALLVDGHSMTSVGLGRVHDEGQERDNVVVGTLGGTSADETLIETLVASLRRGFAPYDLGISVAENVPYSGGFIIRKHHDPAAGIHAVQMEVTMDTYMYEADAEPSQRYALKQQRLDIIRSVFGEAISQTMRVGRPRGHAEVG